ncbi:WD40-repeat-containing domain protein [Phakopsora pachyrhizi]|nr:WD40-repeat-containing domain protein [Phakopsora pachyrhizi]
MVQPAAIQSASANLTLPQVLHYLQSTHRNHLSLQNSWEIERAELRARVALLEGEKRSWEQAKTDLARRVRMLEWALKMERSKYLSHAQGRENPNTNTMPLPAGKIAALRMAEAGTNSGAETPPRPESPKDEEASATACGRNGGTSGTMAEPTGGEQSTSSNLAIASAAPASVGPSPVISIALPLPAVAAQNMARLGTNGNGNTWGGGTMASGMATMMGGTGMGFGTAAMGIGRDPKARARSRDYLKQCLQEINYLTSNNVINPLPQQSALIPGVERPRKILNEIHGQANPHHINHLPAAPPNNLAAQNPSTNHSAITLNQHGGAPESQHLNRSNLYQVSTMDSSQQPNSAFGQSSAMALANLGAYSSLPQAGAPVMTRARSSSRPLMIAPICTTTSTPGTTVPSVTPSQPLTVANLPLLSPSDQQQAIGLTGEPNIRGTPDNEQQAKNHHPNGIAAGVVSVNGISHLAQDQNSGMDSNQGLVDLETNKFDQQGQNYGEGNPTEGATSVFDDSDEPRLTAIYRPESSDAWKEQLRLAGEKEKLRMMRKWNEEEVPRASFNEPDKGNEIKTDEELAALKLGDNEDQQSNLGDRKGVGTAGNKGFDGYKIWKPRKTLRSHLDAARCIAFDRASLAIVSGGDDYTVKLWRLNPVSISNPSPSTWPETEPQITFRGHSAPVTRVAISSSPPRIYSASLDSTVCVWSLPPPEHETYAPYDPQSLLATFVGHSDSIWDMTLLPLRFRDEALLATISADGTVKVWSTDELNSPLKLSWGYNGTDSDSGDNHEAEDKAEVMVTGSDGEKTRVTPTSVAVVWCDLKKVAVSYTNSVVKLFELDSGKMVLRLKSDETFDGTTATQINKVAVHPTLPLLISAHEDRFIRLYDLTTGACTHSMLGHLDAVTSLSIDPTGLTLVSGGHDCSVRFWDLTGSRICIQEVTSHRPKSNEGVLDVTFHPNLPFVASSGADGTVKVFG